MSTLLCHLLGVTPDALSTEYEDQPDSSVTTATISVSRNGDASALVSSHTVDHAAAAEELPTQTKRRMAAKQLACHGAVLKEFPHLLTWWEVVQAALEARFDGIRWDEAAARQKREKGKPTNKEAQE